MVDFGLEASGMLQLHSDNIDYEEFTSLYQKEWQSLFSSQFYLKYLKTFAMKDSLKASNFRSVCWKVFLKCLPEKPDLWIDAVKSQRQQYIEILDKFDTNPRKPECSDITINNPLSQSQQSPWNQYFLDNELKVTIEQDVVRTFPEIKFFHEKEIQKMMISILFCYARKFPHISYKQGMHELLAPILFVLHYDQQAYFQASKTDKLDYEIHVLLNQNYIEHDAFFLFCRLMESVEAWYITSDSSFSKYATLMTKPFSNGTPTDSCDSLETKLKRIYEQLLKHHDTQLFLYLEQMEITPQIFGIRWLRLLFGREFSIHDLLIVWDAIFADSITFNLADYVFIAMLIAIKDLLLKGDYASCLSHLMRYPKVMEIRYIIDLALHLRNPDAFKKPESRKWLNHLQLNLFKDCKHTVNQSLTSNSGNKSQSFFGKLSEGRPKSLNISGVNKLWTNSAELSQSSSHTKQLALNQRSRQTIPSSPDNFDDSSSDFLNTDVTFAVDSSDYFTQPRTSFQNFTKGTHNKPRTYNTTVSQGSFNSENSFKHASYRELVPLSPESSATTISSCHECPVIERYSATLKESVKEENYALKKIISDLQLRNEYCIQKITFNLEKLQERMLNQKLLYEDEIQVSLIGLEKARDILKGASSFTSEYTPLDVNPQFSKTVFKNSSDHSVNNQEELQSCICVERICKRLNCDLDSHPKPRDIRGQIEINNSLPAERTQES